MITYDDAVDIGVFDGRIMTSTTTAGPSRTGVSRRDVKGYRLPLVAGIALIVLGAVGIGYGVFNLVITNIITSREQAALSDAFAQRQALAASGDLGHAFDPNLPFTTDDDEVDPDEFDPDDNPVLVGLEDVESPSDLMSHPDWKRENAPERGEPIGRIEIPQIGVDWTVIHGVSAGELRKGPGHMPRTPMPGQYGNSVISGHRTTYGSPFHRLDELNPGDRFTVETLIGIHTYEVVSLEIVAPDHVWVIQHREGSWLTLTTCHPKFSARQRLIVFAKLVDGPNIDLVTAHYGTTYEAPVAPDGTSPVPTVPAPTTTTSTSSTTTTSTTSTTSTTTTTTTTAPTTTTTTTTTTTAPTTTTTTTTTAPTTTTTTTAPTTTTTPES